MPTKNWTSSDLERLAAKARTSNLAATILSGALDTISDGDVTYLRPGLDPAKAAAAIRTKSSVPTRSAPGADASGSADAPSRIAAPPAVATERSAFQLWSALDDETRDGGAAPGDFASAAREESISAHREATARARAEEARLRDGHDLTPGEVAARAFNAL